MVTFFEEIGLSSDDVVISISNRKVLEEVLGSLGVEGDLFAKTCIVVDKMEKLPPDVIEKQLSDIGHSSEVITKIQTVLGIKDMKNLKSSLDNSAFRILSPVIFDCSAKTLVANCSADISSEKKATFPPSTIILFPNSSSSSLNFLAALKAILVPKAVFPIEGLPAIITRSDL